MGGSGSKEVGSSSAKNSNGKTIDIYVEICGS